MVYDVFHTQIVHKWIHPAPGLRLVALEVSWFKFFEVDLHEAAERTKRFRKSDSVRLCPRVYSIKESFEKFGGKSDWRNASSAQRLTVDLPLDSKRSGE